MTKAIIFLGYMVLICNSFGQSNSMDYRLRWDGTSSVLQVKLDYEPSHPDSTVFVFGNPDFGGQHDIFSVVKNIKCNPSDQLKISNANRQIIIYHKKAAPKPFGMKLMGNTPLGNLQFIPNYLDPLLQRDF